MLIEESAPGWDTPPAELKEDDTPVEPNPEDMKHPILWHSNAPWVGTGYGSQTALFGPAISEKLGHPLAFSTYYGLQLGIQPWVSRSGKTYKVYPQAHESWGNDVLGAHCRHWFRECGKPGVLVTLHDPWVLNPVIGQKLPVISWVPVDHDPLMPRTHNWFRNSGAVPVAMSQFGAAMLEAAGFDPLYAPHAFDPAIFHPGDRALCRKLHGIPQDAFIVGIVAANHSIPSRKCFAEMIDAYAAFAEGKKDVYLYLHTRLEVPDGEDIPKILADYKVNPLATDPYAMCIGAPPELVSTLMNSFDVLLNCSQGEGFGVPLIEAQACGTPCITTNFSSMPEVAPVAVGNWAVTGEKRWTAFQSWQMGPHKEAMVAALQMAYDEPADERMARRASVMQHAHEVYSIDAALPFWEEVLKESLIRFAFREKLMVNIG